VIVDQQHVDNDGNDNLTASYGNDYYPAEWATALQGTRLRHFCPRYRGNTDRIVDFALTFDKLELTGVSSIQNYCDLLSQATQAGVS
jgi:hypothetical protein